VEPRNFSSPDATDKSREARLNKLRERRTKAVTSSESILRPLSSEPKPRPTRSPEPIIDPRFDPRLAENKVKPLPNRQGRIEARPEQRIQNPSANRPEAKTEVRTRRKGNAPNRPIPIKSPAKSLGWQVLRLAIAGVGLSVIAGTAISFWQNQQSLRAKATAPEIVAKEENNKTKEIVPLELKTEAGTLTSKIKDLAAKDKDLSMQMMVVDLD